jgi:hypothetical protein
VALAYEDARLLGQLRVALDQVVARARPDGGWVFGALPGERVHPHTSPLRFAERVAGRSDSPTGISSCSAVPERRQQSSRS